MPAFRGQVIIKTADNVPANYITNNWSFTSPSLTGMPALITPLLAAFYSSVRPYLSPVITQNGHEIKWTALPGVPPNYPFQITTFNLALAPAGTALPDEVCMVSSFEGTKVAGLAQARRRGRVFIGPLNTGSATANRPSAVALAALALAQKTLTDGVKAIGPNTWQGTWSQMNSDLIPSVNGWVDNAFDTQRRRGVQTTSRSVWVGA